MVARVYIVDEVLDCSMTTLSPKKQKEIRKRLLDTLDKGYVSFAELEDEFKEDMEGEYSLCMEDKNTILWANMNKEFIQIIRDLRKEGIIEYYSCHPMIYLIDGHFLKITIGKENRIYKTPHWIPTVLNKKKK